MAELTINQERAIELLLTGKNQREAAETVGVTPQTVTAWMKKPVFSEALQTGREELRRQLRAKRRQLLEKNFDLLDKALDAVDVTSQDLDLVKLTSAVVKLSDQIRQEFDDLPTTENTISIEVWKAGLEERRKAWDQPDATAK